MRLSAGAKYRREGHRLFIKIITRPNEGSSRLAWVGLGLMTVRDKNCNKTATEAFISYPRYITSPSGD
ncbi:hypothetical protein XELAEV_18004030mg [Xenopus laevis]|uniref:Uncharacterized protein n=1 Tax=Xenopus laevis TaxID=8355 RepID=A0A974H089_XENLA|nr:hypothetical protein XELAEV_18004030mg [Xenopus laevis]